MFYAKQMCEVNAARIVGMKARISTATSAPTWEGMILPSY